MLRLGRFHLIRVVLGCILVGLIIAIFANRQEENAILRVDTTNARLHLSEIDAMSGANTTCPICFGRDACHELFNDVSNGALQVSRESQKLSSLNQVVHGIYRNGKVRFWMKTKPPSPSLLQGFESYICSKAAGEDNKGDVANCDISVAAKSSEFLYAASVDLDTIRDLYKYHLVSRRRIPLTICPSWKLVQGLVLAFDDDDDNTLTAMEKIVLLTTLATNPEIAVYKFILNQKLQFPVLPYFGACGRLTFIQGPYKALTDFIAEPLAVRVHLGAQVLQLVDGFIHDDPNWLLFTRDLSYDNFIVTDANQVFLKDLSHVMLIDKDFYTQPDTDEEEVKWSNDRFDKLYDGLVETKNDTNYQAQCSSVFDYTEHMYSLVCQYVLSDLEHDKELRRTNPLAKSYPGLLHHLSEPDADGKPLFEDVALVESLLSRCSSSPNLETRQEAGLQLLQELTFEKDYEQGGLATDDADENIGEEDIGRDLYEHVQDGPPDGDTD